MVNGCTDNTNVTPLFSRKIKKTPVMNKALKTTVTILAEVHL